MKLLSQTTAQALIWDGQQWTVQGTKNIRQALGLGKFTTANSISLDDIDETIDVSNVVGLKKTGSPPNEITTADIKASESAGSSLIVWNGSQWQYQATASVRAILGLGRFATANSISLDDIDETIDVSNVEGIGNLATANRIGTINITAGSAQINQLLVWDNNANQWGYQSTTNVRQVLGLGNLATANRIGTINITAGSEQINQLLVWDNNANQWGYQSTTNVRQVLGLGNLATANRIGTINITAGSAQINQLLVWDNNANQ